MNDLERRAWEAFERKELENAEKLWLQLLDGAVGDEKRASYQSGYAYVLVAMGKFEWAREIYRELFQSAGDHKYLHQLAMVEREAGNLEEALRLIEQEQVLIPEDRTLEVAANLYEKGKLNQLMNRVGEAERYASECLQKSLQTDDRIMLACAHRLMGEILNVSGSPEARVYFKRALQFFREAGDPFGEAEIAKVLSSFQCEE